MSQVHDEAIAEVKPKFGERGVKTEIYHFTEGIASQRGHIIPSNIHPAGKIVFTENTSHGIKKHTRFFAKLSEIETIIREELIVRD